MGDFTGFKFGNKHSSELGIIRVSDGDRYETELHPETEDRTVEIPGLDGGYYFGANYKPKTISVKIAFNSLKEIVQSTQLTFIKSVISLIYIKFLEYLIKYKFFSFL